MLFNIISDPNVNYNLLESEILKVNRKLMPTKLVKFRKHKHKINNWMTHGILKSIKYRDKLYKDLKITNPNISQYDDIHTNLKTYNTILKRSIRLAKKTYYTQ